MTPVVSLADCSARGYVINNDIGCDTHHSIAVKQDFPETAKLLSGRALRALS